MEEETDAQLVARARADDTDAFRCLAERYQPLAFYLALRMVGKEAIAHELVQEALLQAYLSLHRLRDDEHFKSRLTVGIKTLNVLSHASLFIGMFLINEENRARHVSTGTTLWSTITLDWRVPNMDRGIIILGMALQGSGQVWLRDVHLDIIEGDE